MGTAIVSEKKKILPASLSITYQKVYECTNDLVWYDL
jgi:hypothetical protein